VRTETINLVNAWHDQGVSAGIAAQLLDLPARTLRHWRHQFHLGQLQPRDLGRPYVRCAPAQSTQVLAFLHQHGPWAGMPILRGAFADLPAAELRDLLAVFRWLWSIHHPRYQNVLHWQRVGAVWAVDFTEPVQPIDGRFPYVLAVRDLASGLQLAWRPVRDVTAWTAWRELAGLFTVYGAPLVLKSDNGSAFRAAWWKARLGERGVWPLYSPPGCPEYNGSIEASIGSLKTWTQYQAYLAGHDGAWTTVDLERAGELANARSRPHGPRGPTPLQAWESRRAPTADEFQAFAAWVREAEAVLHSELGIAQDAPLDHYEQAALHRRVLTQVLVEHGFLTITRRRIPQRFFGHKVANIW
jgi:transposase InsO family protein